MKKTRSVLSLLTALVLCVGLIGILPAQAADSDFFIKDGYLMEYTGAGGDVVIPSGVIGISDEAFRNCTGLTGVTIPDSVEWIGESAFYGCTGLTSIVIPEGVADIDEYAFARCTALKSAVIPKGITWMGYGMFLGCTSLTSVTISEGATNIIDGMFHSCGSLASITIPASVTEIGMDAFAFCSSLKDVYYEGSEDAWNAISLNEMYNEPLLNAAIHFNSTVPQQTTAYASTQTVTIDGKAVELQAYALKDSNGYLTNYVKLRDVAAALNGSAAQFEVGWDGSVNIITGKGYTANGSEMSTPFSGDRSYTVPTAGTKVNGAAADLSAIVLRDDNGGGYTYYKLRDLGKALGFNVGWSAEQGIFLETDQPYAG